MNVLGYQIDLTFGPLFTLLVAPIIVWWVSTRIGKLLDAQDKLTQERHDNIIGMIQENRDVVISKLDAHCEMQEKLHKQIDERFWKHAHEEGTGHIVIRSEGR